MEGWKGYLALAVRLAKGGAEADHRSAISRAYYAFFHAARSWANAHGAAVDTHGLGGHQALWDWFRSQQKLYMDTIWKDGVALKLARQRADYDDDMPPDLAKYAQAQVLRALQGLKVIAALK